MLRLLNGGKVSLSIGLIASIIAGSIGTVLGITSGYFGGKIDSNKSILNLHMDAHKENEKIKYFYKIKKGISNLKGGLSILKDLNYPKHLIDNAKSFSESV